MTTSTDPKDASSKGKWPSGATFLMYCAGVTLVLLSASLVISGKPFSFSVEGDKVTLHGGLIPQGAPEEKVKEKSAQLQQEFTQAKLNTPVEAADLEPTEMAPFNGRWEGAGSVYEMVQYGNMVILAETTNGITSAYGTGEADGNRAQLAMQTAIGTISVELIAESETEIRVNGPQSYSLRKL